MAPVRPVTDIYFGMPVVDQYRWMESPSAELDTWMKVQNEHARAFLGKLPERDALAVRVTSLMNATARVSSLSVRGGRYFYFKRKPGQETRKLYVRDSQGADEKLLVDPDVFASGQAHYSLDWFEPSPDGKLVAYGVSPGGSEDSVLRVVDVATGKALPDVIDRAMAGVTAWADERSFIYTRLQKTDPSMAPTARYQRQRSFHHVLGTPDDADTALLGNGVAGGPAASEDDWPVVRAPQGSRWVIGALQYGVEPEMELYVASRATLTKGKVPEWTRVATRADAVTGFAIQGDDVFLQTHKGAPRFKVMRTSAVKPDFAHASVVIPESERVIRALAAAKDALYVHQVDGGLARLLRVPYGAAAVSAASEVTLPVDGAIDELRAYPSLEGAWFQFESWTASPRIYSYNVGAKGLVDTTVAPPSSADYSSVTSFEVKAKSADGTMVPLSILVKKDAARDGSHPTWLSGYGAYGYSADPSFGAPRLALLEKGGVFAVCHPRGGGEYGEAWHEAGKKGTKQHTIDDFVACAQELIAEKWTSPAHLVGEGTSAGGVAVGCAITQHPELFAGALIDVGDSNALRSETMPSGPANIPEFGTVRDEEGFHALFAMDAYQHVNDGTPYPAVLLSTGVTDPRVAPWQAAKMTARLQAATSSGKPVLLRVEYDAGHGFGSTKAQRGRQLADQFAFIFAIAK